MLDYKRLLEGGEIAPLQEERDVDQTDHDRDLHQWPDHGRVFRVAASHFVLHNAARQTDQDPSGHVFSVAAQEQDRRPTKLPISLLKWGV